MTSCATHKKCGDITAKKKYHGKRYNQALEERDALCDQTKQQAAQLASVNKELADLKENYNVLNIKYNNLRQTSGSELNKLNEDLDKKQLRLRELESILRKQDSILSVLNASVKNALLGFNPDELTVEMKNGKVYVSMSDKLLFKSGDATVEVKGKEALKKLAEVLNKNADVSIAIEGHTDNVPIKTAIYKDNWDLSAARATNVVRLLTNEYTMDAHRLTASGKGEYFPVADNNTAEGKAKNRRTEIVLSPKLDALMKLISVK
ncbi:MAG: OmpA family protein [Bacteroidetes bacterium]|nr:OmpA family protein [Bacteroidota bacterium]